MATSSNQVRIDARAARDAVSDGQKNSADGLARFNAIGGAAGGVYQLLRNGAVVGQCPVAMSVSGRDITVSQADAWAYVVAADKTTGTWVGRIVNSTDASRYLEFAIPTDQTVSASLTLNAAGQLNPFVVRCPSYDTGTVFPAATDPRVIGWCDPNLPWAAQPYPDAPGDRMVLQISDTWNARYGLQDVPEPGILGASPSDYTFSRVTDPAASGKRAILHRNDNSFPKWGGTARSSYATTATMRDGQVYWMAFAFRLESDCSAAGNYMSVLDVHHNNWDIGPYGRPSVFARAPIGIMITGGLAYDIEVRGCYTLNGDVSDTVFTVVNSSGAVTVGDWHKLVFRFSVCTSWSQSPVIQIWRKINSGSTTKIVDRTDIPISYYDVPTDTHYVKPGAYQWDASVTRRTVHTKGLQLLREAAGTPTIDSTSMMALLDSL